MTKGSGFTLIEMLVSLAVFGLILAGLGAGTRFALQAGERQARVVDRTGELDAVERALRRAFADATPGKAERAGLRGGPDQVAWTTTLPDAPSVSRRIDAVLLVDADHQLVLRWTPHPNGARPQTPTAARVVTLLEKVDRLEIAYWRGEWTRTWVQSDLPALIRIRILFPPGDQRHWPDMVMDTVLQSPQ